MTKKYRTPDGGLYLLKTFTNKVVDLVLYIFKALIYIFQPQKKKHIKHSQPIKQSGYCNSGHF